MSPIPACYHLRLWLSTPFLMMFQCTTYPLITCQAIGPRAKPTRRLWEMYGSMSGRRKKRG
jgi:hypothetical protein